MSEQISLSIGQLAKSASIQVGTLRYYERIGLLRTVERTSGNYRTYGAADLARLGFIRRARGLGFTLEQVRTLLDLADQREKDCCEVDALARAHLDEVEQKIADLTALGRELRDMIGHCETGRIAECRIIEALSPQ